MIGKLFRRKKETKKKYETVVTEITAPEGTNHLGPVFAAPPPSLHISSEYEDNKIFCRELRVSLSFSDWCKFEKQDFYLQLIQWVCSLENSDSASILAALREGKGLPGTELNEIPEYHLS